MSERSKPKLYLDNCCFNRPFDDPSQLLVRLETEAKPMNDTVLLDTGMDILVERLGLVEAERFIYLVNKEPFDYTKFHHALFEGMTMDEICEVARAASEEVDERTKQAIPADE